MEKLNNSPRHSPLNITLHELEEILAEHDYCFEGIDQLVIDGWDNWNAPEMASEESATQFRLQIPLDNGKSIQLCEVAAYGHVVQKQEDVLAASTFITETGGIRYKSYKHVAGHFFGAYCTSPLAEAAEDSFVLVWDGGMPPQLFYYKNADNEVLNLGPLFPFTGYLYINFAHAFRPFDTQRKSLSIAGKAMAHMALGSVDPQIVARYRKIFSDLEQLVGTVDVDIDVIAVLTAEFIKQAKRFSDASGIPHRHMLASFQSFIQDLLLENLARHCEQLRGFQRNLCFVGGSALNIKWNSKIRESGLFRSMWVPPFTNDSGSALGAACCEMLMTGGIKALEWSVYSGPSIKKSAVGSSQYSRSSCTLKELASVIHYGNEPVVFLNGRAELGPRALGNRSILAAATDPNMKSVLNRIKRREDYRPVAPVCLEEDAARVFDPGTADPFMLYEHRVRGSWKDRVPAIRHLDGTARLQTVTRGGNDVMHQLLCHYKELSGVPLLCNTSANLSGKGFFPDVRSALDWGMVNFVWSDGEIYFLNRTQQELEWLKTRGAQEQVEPMPAFELGG